MSVKRATRIVVLSLAVALAVPTTMTVLRESGVWNKEVWEREHPLEHPIAVTGVLDGVMVLADGRAFRPVGIHPREGVPQDVFDAALRAATAQGVEVVRDLGDGQALLTGEPIFFNPCGTRGYLGSPYVHWAGCYLPCPISEFLVFAGFASPTTNQPALTPRERWRLEGATELRYTNGGTLSLANSGQSFRFDPTVRWFANYDELLEGTWKSPPP